MKKSIGSKNSQNANKWASDMKQKKEAAKKLKAQRDCDAKSSDYCDSKYLASRSHELNQDYMVDFYKSLEGPTVVEAAKSSRLDSSSNGSLSYPISSQIFASQRFPAQFSNLTASDSKKTYDVSDRPILCGGLLATRTAVWGVFGCSDHALYSIDISSESSPNRLYGRTAANGHSEWVTDLAMTSNSQILSADAAGCVCIWNSPSATRCTQKLQIHSGPISKILTDSSNPSVFLTCSYDCKVAVLSSTSTSSMSFLTASCPLLTMDYLNNTIACGGRDGSVSLFSSSSSSSDTCRVLNHHHTGHTTRVKFINNNTLASGGQDGIIKLTDLRSSSSSSSIDLYHHVHVGVGIGAVSEIWSYNDNDNLIYSYGADDYVCVSDVRNPSSTVATSSDCRLHNFIYSSVTSSDGLILGCGDGQLVSLDVSSLALISSVPSGHSSAVRCLLVHQDAGLIISAGDDGKIKARRIQSCI